MLCVKDSPNSGLLSNFVCCKGIPAPETPPSLARYDAIIMEPPSTPPTPVPSGRPDRFATAHRILSDAIAARTFPGCAYGVIARGKTLLHGALGRFTYDEGSPAVEPDTVFDVASLTKVVATTAAAMLLHQRGHLDLDTPVGELLPGFVVGRPRGDSARHVTLRHLLAHNSGLPGYVEFFRTCTSPGDLLRACLALDLVADPGVRVEYSDPGFILLGKALEVAAREGLASFIHREVFAPLGLTSTRFDPPRLLRDTIAPTEYDATFRKRVIQGEVQDENAFVLRGASGHAGLFTNVPDLLRFSASVLSLASPEPSETNPPTLFTSGTVQRFAERQGPEGSTRALGWDTPSDSSSSGRHFSPRSIGHLGYSGCSLWIDLDASIAVVLLTNRTWPDRTSQLIKQVRPAFHDAVREALAIP